MMGWGGLWRGTANRWWQAGRSDRLGARRAWYGSRPRGAV